MQPMQTIFFTSIADLRHWLTQNQENEGELWVGIYKKESGRQIITSAEVVDEALCFGWAESRVKKIDALSYAIRLSPRKAGSRWSRKNIQKAQEFMALGLMEPAGELAFLSRDKSADNYDVKGTKLSAEYERLVKKHPDAWMYWEQASPSYRKHASRWIMQAKREDTRMKRLQILIESSENGEKIPLLR